MKIDLAKTYLVLTLFCGCFLNRDLRAENFPTNVESIEQLEADVNKLKREWHFQEEIDPIDGTPNVAINKLSEDSVTSKFGKEFSPLLMIRCFNNELELFISAQEYLGQSPISVDYRIDEALKKDAKWTGSSNRKAIFAPDASQVIKLLRGAKKMVVRYIPYNESPRTLQYDLTGIDAPLNKVLTTCKVAL